MIEMIEIMEMMRRRRRNRIDSPQELVVLIVAGLAYLGVQLLFKHVFPDVPQKTVKAISLAAVVIVVAVGAMIAP